MVYCRKGGVVRSKGAMLLWPYRDHVSELFVPIFKDTTESYPSVPRGLLNNPVTKRENPLRSRVISGGGSNVLILEDYAITSVSLAQTVHCTWRAFYDAMISTGNTGVGIILPQGEFSLSRHLHIFKPISLRGSQGFHTFAGTKIYALDGFGISVDLKEAQQWCPGKLYRLGEIVRGVSNEINPGWIQCILSGWSGTAEPVIESLAVS